MAKKIWYGQTEHLEQRHIFIWEKTKKDHTKISTTFKNLVEKRYDHVPDVKFRYVINDESMYAFISMPGSGLVDEIGIRRFDVVES